MVNEKNNIETSIAERSLIVETDLGRDPDDEPAADAGYGGMPGAGKGAGVGPGSFTPKPSAREAGAVWREPVTGMEFV